MATATAAATTTPAATAARKPASRKAAAANAPLPVAPPAAVPLPDTALVGAAPAVAPADGWPAANNGPAWLALLLAGVPGLADARGHKYGDGKGLLPVGGVPYTLTAWGADAANAGGKSTKGRYTVQALMCVAHAMAAAATGVSNPCGAAVAYFAYTAPVLALLQPPYTKTARYIGAPKPGCYNVPCPRWVSDYLRGNARTPALLFNAVA